MFTRMFLTRERDHCLIDTSPCLEEVVVGYNKHDMTGQRVLRLSVLMTFVAVSAGGGCVAKMTHTSLRSPVIVMMAGPNWVAPRAARPILPTDDANPVSYEPTECVPDEDCKDKDKCECKCKDNDEECKKKKKEEEKKKKDGSVSSVFVLL